MALHRKVSKPIQPKDVEKLEPPLDDRPDLRPGR